MSAGLDGYWGCLLGLVGVAVGYSTVGAAAAGVVVAVSIVTVESGLTAIGASAVGGTIAAVAGGLTSVGVAGGVSFCFRKSNRSKSERSESSGGESFEVHVVCGCCLFGYYYSSM